MKLVIQIIIGFLLGFLVNLLSHGVQLYCCITAEDLLRESAIRGFFTAVLFPFVYYGTGHLTKYFKVPLEGNILLIFTLSLTTLLIFQLEKLYKRFYPDDAVDQSMKGLQNITEDIKQQITTAVPFSKHIINYIETQ